MMNQLIDRLHADHLSLVILHEGRVATYEGQGVRTLYHILDNEPELLLDAKVAIAAAGHTAAQAMKEGGVVEVYADYISEQAYDTLHAAGIKVTAVHKVSHHDFLKIWERMGETLDDSQGNESGHPQTLRGLGLLPTRTVFTAEKRRAQVTATADAPFAGAALTGYEIHTGRTAVDGAPFCRYTDGTPEGCVQNAVFGTYLHGLFDSGELTERLAAYLCRRKGIAPETAAPLAMADYRTQQLDLLADGVRSALDMDAVYAAMGLHDPRGGKK